MTVNIVKSLSVILTPHKKLFITIVITLYVQFQLILK